MSSPPRPVEHIHPAIFYRTSCQVRRRSRVHIMAGRKIIEGWTRECARVFKCVDTEGGM